MSKSMIDVFSLDVVWVCSVKIKFCLVLKQVTVNENHTSSKIFTSWTR